MRTQKFDLVPSSGKANPERTRSIRPTVLANTTTSMGAVRSSCTLKHYTSLMKAETAKRMLMMLMMKTPKL